MFYVITDTQAIRPIHKCTAKTKKQAKKFVESYGATVTAVFTRREWNSRKGEARFCWDFETDYGRVLKCGSLTDTNGNDIKITFGSSFSELVQESGVTVARKIAKERCAELGYKLVDITPVYMAQNYRIAQIEAINETR